MTVGGVFLIVVGSLALWFFVIGPLISLLICHISHMFYDGYWDLVLGSVPTLIILVAAFGIIFFGYALITEIIAQWNVAV